MNRCDGPTTDLDDPDAEPQTPAKTEVLFQMKSPDELWSQHGLIHDFHVCPTVMSVHMIKFN